MDAVERTVRWVLLAGVGMSVALMSAGLVLGLLDGSAFPRAVAPLGGLLRGLAALEPGAYLSLGLIVLVATPFVRVVGSLIAFAREPDVRFVLVTAAVFVVMCLGVALGKM